MNPAIIVRNKEEIIWKMLNKSSISITTLCGVHNRLWDSLTPERNIVKTELYEMIRKT